MVTSVFEDLTPDGAVRKQVIQEGDGEEVERGSKVKVRYVLKLGEGDKEKVVESSENRKDGIFAFVVGRNKVVPMLEIVVSSMRQGEKCLVRSESSYAFGMKGLERKGIPGDTVVWMEVEMVSVEGGKKVVPLEAMTARERLDTAKSFKERGNEMFKGQKFDKARGMYVQSIRYLSNVFYKPAAKRKEEEKKEDNEKENGFEQANVVNDVETNVQKEQGNEDVNGTVKEEDEVVQVIDISSQHEQQTTHQDPQQAEQTNGDEQKQEEQAAQQEPVQVEHANGNDQQQEQQVDEQKPVQDEHTNGNDQHVQQPADDTNQTTTGEQEQDQAEEHNDDPDEKEVKTLHVTTLNNLSLCLVKMENYRQAVEKASLALKLDPQSHKALYYRYVYTLGKIVIGR